MFEWVAIGAMIAASAVFIVVAYRRKWRWTGFTEAPAGHDTTGGTRQARTLWDWMQLAVVPLALTAVGFLFNAAQGERDARRAERQADVDRQVERSRAASEARLGAENRDEETFRRYTEQMSQLMLNSKLRTSRKGSEERSFARTLTLTTLRQLDGERRGLLVRFVAEAGLIKGRDPKVDLTGAVLRGADLPGAPLENSMLQATDLRDAWLDFAQLTAADLRWADLRGATFFQSILNHANLSNACLSRVVFFQADLRDADLSRATGDRTNFTLADLRHARLAKSEFYKANFRTPPNLIPQGAPEAWHSPHKGEGFGCAWQRIHR